MLETISLILLLVVVTAIVVRDLINAPTEEPTAAEVASMLLLTVDIEPAEEMHERI
jgi:hypothetical protein